MWRDWLARAFGTLAISTVVVGLCAVWVVPALVPVLRNPPPTVVVRDVDPGGPVTLYEMWWKRVAESGARVVIDGDCVSACTFVLGIVPPDRVCVTDRATFGIHMAWSRNEQGEPEPNKEATDRIIRQYYPPVVKAWILKHQPLTLAVQYMPAAELNGYYHTCTEREYKQWPVTESPPLLLRLASYFARVV